MVPPRALPHATSILPSAFTLTASYQALTETNIEILPSPEVTLFFTYTRGAVGGTLLVKLEWGDAAGWFWDTTPTGSTTVTSGTIKTPVAITIAEGPAPQNGSALGFELTFRRRAGATRMRVSVADSDATPGSLTIAKIATGGV